jgi:hypothetical protein
MKWFVMVLVGMLCWGEGVAAQAVPTRQISVSDRPSAVLNLRELIRLGSLDGEHDAFGRVMDVALDSRGRIVVADDLRHRLTVFSADGRFLGSMGRRGRGPAEFESPWRVAVDARDSIFVWDVALARISVFAPDLSFARSFPVPPQWVINTIRFLPDGKLLVAAYARDAQGSLHLVSRTGRVERSFGPRFDAPDLAGFEGSLLGGTLDLTTDGIVYSTKSPYEIWFFDHEGRTVRRCVGRPEWTTNPASVVRTDDGGNRGLQWRSFVHSSGILALDGGLLMNQVLDPSGDRSFVDVLTADCRLLRRTVLAPPMTVARRSGTRFVGVRNLEHPEVVVFEQQVVRR